MASTTADQLLRDAAATGAAIDFRRAGDDVRAGATWEPRRAITAQALSELLTRPTADGRQAPPVSVAGARITGELDLEGQVMIRPLTLLDCYFEEAVTLDEARAPRIDVSGCRLVALRARQIETRGDVTLDRLTEMTKLTLAGARIGGALRLRGASLAGPKTTVLDGTRLDVRIEMDCDGLECDGELRLLGAHVGGWLTLAGARLSNPQAIALNGVRLQVDHDLRCHSRQSGRRFRADGELRLSGAHIGGQLNLAGALLVNPEGAALNAYWLKVDQDVLCYPDAAGQRFDASGELRLARAQVGGQLNLIGAHLANADGPALNAVRLEVGQGVFCQSGIGGLRFEADGELRLTGAHIGGRLSLADAHVTNPKGPALHFERGRASRLVLPRLDGATEVDLTDAAVTEFHDDLGAVRSREDAYRARVSGFTYASLGPAGTDRDARVAWLAHAADGYVPQAYDQLAGVLRRAGRDDDAKHVLIAKQVERRRGLSRLGKAASFVFWLTMGYGYKTWRAAAGLAAVVALGWAIFAAAYPGHMVAMRPASQLPAFNALLYSLDAALPIVDLGQESAWTPTGAAQAWYAFSVLAGWLLGLGLVAFLTARFFRE